VISLPQDVKVVYRRLRATRATSLLVVATLGLVLGANTLAFSFLNEILLNPLPAIADKSGLVNVHRFSTEQDGLKSFSFPAFQNLAQSEMFEKGLVGYNGRGLSLQRGETPSLVFGMLVSENYFEALGVRPGLGRGLSADDNHRGAEAVVVLSDSIWRARFASDPGILESSIRLNGHPFRVIGIAPPRFAGHFVGFAADLWLPLAWAPMISGQKDLMEDRGAAWIETFGRLRAGTANGAEAALTRLSSALAAMDGSLSTPERILVEPLTGIDRELRMPVAAFLALLQGATLVVALIALVNVSSLLLARSLDRRQETAVRLALGASRKNLLAPFAIEAVVLCGLGSLAGLAIALLVARVAPGWLPPIAIPLRFDLALDGATFAFSCAVAFAGTLVATLGPGLAAARAQPSSALVEGGTQRTARSKWRSALVITQVAFATTVLVCGSVFALSLAQAASASPGFDIDRVQVTRLDTSVLGLSGDAATPLQQRALEAVASVPGVERTAFARVAPYSLGTPSLDVRETSSAALKPWVQADWNSVSPGFFETLGIGVTRGRTFTDFDQATAPRVVVISEALARRVFAAEDPIGRSLAMGPTEAAATVVGVVRDVSLRRLGEAPRPLLFRPFHQAPSSRITIFARSASPDALSVSIRSAVFGAAPDLPLLESMSLRESASFSQSGARLGSRVGLALGGLGLILAAVGLFGLIAQTVSARVREIAIRMAMGASARQILRLVLAEGSRLGASGIGIGLLCALGAAPLIGVVAPMVNAMDPVAFGVAALAVMAVVLGATLGPAWRASRVTPQSALRSN
jgi:predicted permease